MRIDLHLHSSFSDGELAVSDLLRLAEVHELHAVAVTDHDDLRSIAAVRAYSGPLRVLPGVEVTAHWRAREVHCLGYGVSDGDVALAADVAAYRRALVAAWEEILRRALPFGSELAWRDIEERLGTDRIPYSGDVLALVHESAPPSSALAQTPRRALVERWFAPRMPLYVEPPAPPPLKDTLARIAGAGGCAVLAHAAADLTREELAADVPALAEAGLAGLEAWSSWHRDAEADAAFLVALCAKHDLVATAGSDFHGTRVKPWVPHPGAVGPRHEEGTGSLAGAEAMIELYGL